MSITANQTSRNNINGGLGNIADEDTGPITPAGAQAMSYTNIGAGKTWAIAGYGIIPAILFTYTSSGGLNTRNTVTAIQKARILQSGGNSTASGTTVTVTWGASTTAGSLLIAEVGSTTIGSINTPTGWRIAAANTGVTPKSILFYQENAPSTTSTVFSITGAPAAIVVKVAEIANAALSSPIDSGVISSGSTNSAINFAAMPGVELNTSEIGVGGWTNAAASTNISSVTAVPTEVWTITPTVTAGSLSCGLIINLGNVTTAPQTLIGNYGPGAGANYSTELVFFKPYLFLSTTPSGTLSLSGTATASSGTTSSYSYNASGGLSLGNSVSVSPTYLYAASGGLTLNNSVNVSLNFSYNASGGLSLSNGVGLPQISFNYLASGGLSLSNSSDVRPTYIYNASGGLTLGNASNVTLTYVYNASGGLSIGGSATATQSSASYTYNASGGLSVSNSADVRPTYIYSASGGLSLGNGVTSQIVFSYSTSGSLGLGNTSNVTPTYVYISFGGLSLSGSATVTTTSTQTYLGSGNLSFSNSADVRVTYLYAASGGLSLAASANANPTFNYLASGKLTFSNNAGVVFQPTQLSVVASGNIALGSTATVRVTYIYRASGYLSFTGSFNGSIPKSQYTYEARGSITFSGKLHRPFDIRQLPFTDYWDLIEDAMAKARETRTNCNNPISETAFLGALRNDRVREMISLSTSWRVICYLGNGVYDIEIDGRRMNVDSFLTISQIVIPPFIPPVHIVPAPESELKEFVTVNYLTKDFVLSNLKANSRVKKMLLSPDTKDWVAELIDGIVAITITTVSNQTVKISVNLEAQAVDTVIPATTSTVNIPSTSKNLATSYVDTLPKEAILTLLGPTSFLRNVPMSNWEVLGINGVKIDVKLNNGVIFSVPLR